MSSPPTPNSRYTRNLDAPDETQTFPCGSSVTVRLSLEIHGIAVHDAARILALAEAGEILGSSTTRDLASGAGLVFVDRGTHRLKGVPAERQAFALASNGPS